MRLQRYGFILLSMYLMFFGGSGFYTNTMEVRLFHHALMTGLIVYWLGRRLLRGEGLPHTPINPYLYALVGVWLAAAALGIDPRLSFERTWYLILYVMIFYFLVDLFQRGYQRLVMEALFLIGAVIVMITLIEVLFWYFGAGFQNGWFEALQYGVIIPMNLPERFSLAMNITNLQGAFTAALSVAILGWAAAARRQERRLLIVLGVALLLVMLGTRTRGAYMAFGAGIVAFLLLQATQIPNLRAKLNAHRLLIAGGVLLLVVGLGGLVLLLGEETGRDTGDLVRLDMMRAAVEMTQDYPVSGVGTGAFGRALRDYRTPELARDRMAIVHSLGFAIASENGLLGLAAVTVLSIAFLYAVYRIWQRATPTDRTRRAALFAALVGMAVHNLVDTFQVTNVVLLPLVIFAYLIVPTDQSSAPRKGNRLIAVIALIGVLAYGVWMIAVVDRASLRHVASIALYENDEYDAAISAAVDAAAIDPGLNLYPLQVAFLHGEQWRADPTPSHAEAAVEAYEHAVTLEPTWDTGWLNLAALESFLGRDDAAYEHVQRAYTINPLNAGHLALARYAEQFGESDDETIIHLYTSSIYGVNIQLPLADFWGETPLRLEATRRFADNQPLDLRYRIYRVHFENEAASLVPENPQTAAEYWVAGESAYEQGDLATAAQFFDEAVKRARNGDYYVSRARATRNSDLHATMRDLLLADLLDTRVESPDALRAELQLEPENRDSLLAGAVPPFYISYAFQNVLYNRRSAPWRLLPPVSYPGPGRAVMQPWYTLAEEAEARGNIDRAIYVYEALVSNAPDETEAAERLATLKAQRD